MAPLGVTLLQVTTSSTTGAATTGSGSLFVVVAELAVSLGVILVVGTLLTKFVHGILRRAGAPRQVTSSITEVMGVIMLLAGVGVVSTLSGLSSYFTALTISGIAGLAVSLALQTTLSNIISGILMLRDGVVHVGDDLQYGGPGGIRGEVVRVSLRTTWLRTADGTIAVIGNSNLAAGPIINYTARARLDKKIQS
jgi:small conductance mechanosensitive channel